MHLQSERRRWPRVKREGGTTHTRFSLLNLTNRNDGSQQIVYNHLMTLIMRQLCTHHMWMVSRANKTTKHRSMHVHVNCALSLTAQALTRVRIVIDSTSILIRQFCHQKILSKLKSWLDDDQLCQNIKAIFDFYLVSFRLNFISLLLFCAFVPLLKHVPTVDRCTDFVSFEIALNLCKVHENKQMLSINSIFL